MSISGVAGPVGRCPDRDALAAFNLGKLPAPTLEAIGSHVSTCEECDAALSALQEASDSLVAKLRGCEEQDTLEEESGCGEMEARVRAFDFSREATTCHASTGPGRPRAQDTPLPAQVGPYEVLHRIGRGGMGVVYKARQTPVNRLVALKMISSGVHASPQTLARFAVEGQAIARLQHPNVIQIYDFGEHEGLPYYSMELAEGGSLAKRLASGPLPVREAAEVVRVLALAVQYAHERQVLHRDLKPGNILVGAGGVPKISDFGLAKLLDVESGQTVSEAVLGTPSYMAPEQAEGKPAVVGPVADVYALGVILYEALTGQPPFRGADKAETMRMVCLLEPEPPSRRRPEVPRDLEAVCLKCLEKKPERRYRSAQALEKDLDRWLAGEPTVARPQRWPSRVWRKVRRRPVLGCVTLALMGALTLFLMVNPDPDRPLRELRRELVQGKSVTLIGKTGMPRWVRVRFSEDKTQTSVADDGTFSVSTWDMALVELLPEVPCDRYRLRAEVSHKKSLNHGEAGFYFAHSAHPGPYSDMHIFTAVDFNEVVPQKDLWALIPFKKKPPEPKGNRVRLETLVYGKGSGEGTGIGSRGIGFRDPYSLEGLFAPAGPLVGPWRAFEVIITPDSISAVGRGMSLTGGDLVTHMPTQGISNGLERNLPNLRKEFPDQPVLQGLPAAFQGRGGVGLYLMHGDACFRSVEITPLVDAD